MSPENQKREPQPVDRNNPPERTSVDPSTADKVRGGDTSPRDPATGLPTGKRM
jgi:hypothetical protein